MASYTTNLNLKKPAGSEAVVIGDINGNMDTIDQAYGTLTATKAEVVNLSGVSANATKTLTIGKNTRALIFLIGTSSAKCGWIINSTSAADTSVGQIVNPLSSVTVAGGSGSLTITNGSSVNCGLYALIFAGSVSES